MQFLGFFPGLSKKRIIVDIVQFYKIICTYEAQKALHLFGVFPP